MMSIVNGYKFITFLLFTMFSWFGILCIIILKCHDFNINDS
jgi:hypothetical protein